MRLRSAILAAALAFVAVPAWAQNFDLTADQVFASVGRCTVEAEQLRKALAAANASIGELKKQLPPPPVPDAAVAKPPEP
jgi:hypothetical protein